MLERYLNIYPRYTGRTVYDSFEEARKACGDDPTVKTIRLVEVTDIIDSSRVDEDFKG